MGRTTKGSKGTDIQRLKVSARPPPPAGPALKPWWTTVCSMHVNDVRLHAKNEMQIPVIRSDKITHVSFSDVQLIIFTQQGDITRLALKTR